MPPEIPEPIPPAAPSDPAAASSPGEQSGDAVAGMAEPLAVECVKALCRLCDVLRRSGHLSRDDVSQVTG